MPKRVADLLRPDLPAPRQPHTAIVALLLADRSKAYSFDEVLEAVRTVVPRWRVTRELPVTERVVLEGAIDELLFAGVIAELADGSERFYALQPELTPDPGSR
jgi:hypothetical protein